MIRLKRTSRRDFYFAWIEDDPVFQEIDQFLGVEHKQGEDWQIYDSHWPCTPHVTHLIINTDELADEFAEKFAKPEAGYHEDYEPSEWVANGVRA
jgi:hypothetical protein